MNLTQNQRRAVRRIAGESWTACPVTVIQGNNPPERVGESFRWETKTGIPIAYPSAYSRKGWSSMVYCASTRQVVVGEGWMSSV